jgi:hypothetical protein
MIRCAWCGAENYAIDSWCAGCSRHLDWPPPSRAAVLPPPPPPPVVAASAEPSHPPRRRRLVLLAPAAAALGVAIVLALPVASWFSRSGGVRPALPNTALRPSPSAALASTAPVQPTPAPQATPTPEVTPVPTENATPPVARAQPAEPADGDPAAAIARFYQDVSGHDFAAAAALWSSRMQARYPPAVYIDHRFAATQQINLQAARIVGNRGGQAIVYVRVVEVLDGQTRHWVGTWQLVNTESGWLLDRPNLQSGT